MIFDRLVYILVRQKCPVKRVEADSIPTAHGNIAGHIIYASTLGRGLAKIKECLRWINLRRLDLQQEAPGQMIAGSNPRVGPGHLSILRGGY